MTLVPTHPAERFLDAIDGLVLDLGETPYAISGDAARCLWQLHCLSSPDQWRRLSRPWPTAIDLVGPTALPPPGRPDPGPIAREFAPTMLHDRAILHVGPLEVCVAPPPFVLASILCEDDPIRVTRVAALLRALAAAGRTVDPEDVRHLLKAVALGDRFDDYLDVVRCLPASDQPAPA